MADALKVGSAIPPFFLKDHEGFDVTDEDVLGTPLVIFFYGKDGTPTCTEEILAFRENQQKFDLLQTLVIGVSPDNVDSHKKLIKEHKLQFSLLSDVKKDMAQMFGVLNEKNEPIRTTFVIDSQGVIKWIEKPVNVKDHVERVLKAIDEHCKEDVVKFDEFEEDYAEFLHGKKQTQDEKLVQDQIKKEFGLNKNDNEKKKK